ncbi:MAG TPA: PAS domain-containing sensor histidine kinase [Rubricoccaceae bacterium]|nr:PAS domain-containing sensor histidine kinase [Rubricoccaceae bacterium]
MAQPLARPPGPRDAQAQLYLFRLMCVIGGTLTPAFGVLYALHDPYAYDPWWMRAVLTVGPLLGFACSFVSPFVQRRALALGQVAVYAYTFWVAGLAYANNVSPDYAVGYFFVLVAATTLLSLAHHTLRPLMVYLVVAFVLTGTITTALPAPEVGRSLFTAYVLALGVVLLLIAAVRLQVIAAFVESEANLAEAQRTARLGNWVWEAATGRTYWSDEMYRIAGVTPGRALPTFEALAARADEADRAAVQAFWKALTTGHPHGDLVVRLAHDDGTTRAVRCRGEVQRDRNGRVERVAGVCLDVTPEFERQAAMHAAWIEAEAAREEAERARAEAEEMARLKSAFLANMSHEIRTPLTAIIGFAQVLAEEVDAEHADLVGPIESGGRRLLDTLNSVLDLARLRADRVILCPERVDVAEEAHEVATMLRVRAQEKGLALTVHGPPCGVYARADRSALQRVLSNLVSNAVKFTDAGRIVVGVEAGAGEVRLRVRDTGRGISAEFLPVLFEEFRQESTGLNRSHEGSGLGLAITKGLVDLMGGTIAVESREGEGSVFTVTLPAEPVEAPAVPLEGDGVPREA